MSAPLIAYKVVDNQRHLFSEGAQSVYWPRLCVDVQAGVYLPIP